MTPEATIVQPPRGRPVTVYMRHQTHQDATRLKARLGVSWDGVLVYLMDRRAKNGKPAQGAAQEAREGKDA